MDAMRRMFLSGPACFFSHAVVAGSHQHILIHQKTVPPSTSGASARKSQPISAPHSKESAHTLGAPTLQALQSTFRVPYRKAQLIPCRLLLQREASKEAKTNSFPMYSFQLHIKAFPQLRSKYCFFLVTLSCPKPPDHFRKFQLRHGFWVPELGDIRMQLPYYLHGPCMSPTAHHGSSGSWG